MDGRRGPYLCGRPVYWVKKEWFRSESEDQKPQAVSCDLLEKLAKLKLELFDKLRKRPEGT